MGHYHFEGLGIPVNDQEMNYLQTESTTLEMTGALERAGAESIRWALAKALEYEGSPVTPDWDTIVRQYRALAQRQYPMVYRIKLSVTIEEASEPEIEEFWRKQRYQEPVPPGAWVT